MSKKLPWLKKPCANCPFNKVGAIHLAPGRVRGIVAHLLQSDYHVFHCHKTVHCKKGGEWTEDSDGNEKYLASGNEAICTGSLIYLLKKDERVPVQARVTFMFDPESYDDLLRQANTIIDSPT